MNPLTVGALIVIAMLTLGVTIQTKRLESIKAEYATFVAKTKAIGDEQERKTKERIALDQKRKEVSDAENKRTTDALRVTIKRLRDQHTDGRFVPPAPAGATSPQLACYGRDRLDSEIRGFVGEATEILGILATDAVALNSAKEWASSSDLLRRPPAPRIRPSLRLTKTLETSK